MVTLALLWSGTQAWAADGYDVARHNLTIAVDGQIDAAEWSGVAPQPLLHEIDPRRVADTSWQTTVRLAHDGRNLLLAIEARDAEADQIVAARGARDTIGNEDYVTVQIDAEGTRQRHYEFRVNAAGVLDDRIAGGTGSGSPQWSGAWTAVARRGAAGYAVELSIPLTTLNARSTADGKLNLPLNVTRHIGRDRRETVALLPVNMDQLCQECQYETFTLVNVDGEKQALQLRPYVAVRQASSFPAGAASSKDTSFDPGVDVLWKLGAGRKVVATVNPDFSEVAPDQIQFDVNRRFAVSFSENRPFFTENAGMYGAQMPLVYTRSIADPDVAVAYSAQTSKVSIGAIYASDRATSFIQPGQNGSRLVAIDDKSETFIARLQRNGEQGRRGSLIITDRRATGYENLVAAVDTRQTLGEHQSIEGIVAISRSDASPEIATTYDLPEHRNGEAGRVLHSYKRDHLSVTSLLVRSSTGFRADAGNLNRVGMTFAYHEWYWNVPRPSGGRVSNFGGGVWGNSTRLTHNPDEEQNLEAWGFMNLADGSGMDGFVHYTHEIFQGRPFNEYGIGGSYGWQINPNVRVFAGINRRDLVDVIAVESAVSTRPFWGFNLKAGSTLSLTGNFEFDSNIGATTRNFRTSSAIVRANWSPRLGHTVSMVANWGGTRERYKLTIDPVLRTDRARGQLVYLYQRADRSQFHIGVNIGGSGSDGLGSLHKSDQLLFGKAILNLDWGN